MGSVIEFNDTLKIKEDEFPGELAEGEVYSFHLNDRRIFHLHPVRVFLVKEIEGKWDYVGHVYIIEQTINAMDNTTSGRFIVSKLYTREYVEIVNRNEPPNGKGYVK